MINSSQYASVFRAARRELDAGATVDDVLVLLRDLGLSQPECILAVVNLGLSTQADAKRLVHYSRAWDSSRRLNERFHAELEEALNELPEP